MSHAVMISSKVFAKDVDALVRSFKSTIDLDNGNVITLNGGVSVTAGEGEVYTAATPTSVSVTDIWMVGEPEVVLIDGKYKGLDPDPRNFYVAANTIGTAFKIKKYDIVRLTADAFTNSVASNTYVGLGTTGAKLTWQASSSNAVFRLIEATTIPIASGSPGSNRVTAYRLEAIAE